MPRLYVRDEPLITVGGGTIGGKIVIDLSLNIKVPTTVADRCINPISLKVDGKA